MQKKKAVKNYPKWFYFILVLIPLIFLFILELSLVYFNYGNDYSTFVKISDKFENYKFFNPKLPQKYFGNLPIRPSVIADGFKKYKDDNTFRIFALGGSTTAGYPHTANGSFPRLLKNKLKSKYPHVNFEVINLGVSAINSITIRDIIEDVVNENPELIIFYAGHNEYYGALGPASNISGFYNLSITRLILGLKEFRTVQLIENLIANILSAFSDKSSAGKTLMSELAGKNLVPVDSESYWDGVDQFESNLQYIISSCEEEKIPIIIGTLASNLMQAPLCRFVGCNSLYDEFKLLTNKVSSISKDKLFEIKDEDELRFRAPEQFNSVIQKLKRKYSFHVADVQKMLEENSPNGIIGNNLMLDHLHPSYQGNELIAELLFDSIISDEKINSKLKKIASQKVIINSAIFNTYTGLDSSFAELRIQHLKSDFPFVKQKNTLNFFPKSERIQDKIAKEVVQGKISWESGHIKLANHYLERDNLHRYLEELNVLIEDKPFDKFIYLKIFKTLEDKKQFELLKYFLHKYHNYFQDSFSALKLANIYFNERNNTEAIFYYEKCIPTNDPKIFFNLSASYFGQQNLNKAILYIQRCLKINPDYPNAKKIYQRLLKISESAK